MNDESAMPFGKYKGEKLANVPAEYLLYIYENYQLFSDLRQYITDNLDVIKSDIEYNKKKNNII